MPEENPDLAVILARLENVERQNRHLKRGGIVGALWLAMVFIMGQAKTDNDIQVDTVKAHQIYADMVTLSGQDGATTLLTPGFMMAGKDKDLVFINTLQGPSLQVIDRGGFQAEIGVSSLATIKTGETRRTSAASVVLFGKEKKVLWSAP
jgi:hypothetical protein